MTWSAQDDAQVIELLKKHATLQPGTDDHFLNKELIVNKVHKNMRSAFMTCVYNWKRKYNIDESDGESLIYENLLHAINTYKVEKAKGKFMSFFWNVNSCMFKNYLSKIYAQKRTPQTSDVVDSEKHKTFFAIHSLSSPAPTQNESQDQQETLENMIKDINSFEDATHYKLLLKKLYQSATSRQKRVLKRLFFGKTYNEIGSKLNMSVPQICNLLKKIRKEQYIFEKDV